MASITLPNLPSTMRAAVVARFHQPYEIRDALPLPEVIDSHDIVIRVAVASFCHTDMMVLAGMVSETPKQEAGSHEPTGTVVSLGADAVSLGFSLGDRIAAIGWRGLCGECIDCKGPIEQRHYCRFMKGYVGTTLPGAFADYAIVDARYAVVLPDTLSFVTAAPLTCAGATVWRAVQSTRAQPGEWIGIVGSGGGLAKAILPFNSLSRLVVAVDAREEGLELSRESGAQLVLDARKGKEALENAITEAIGDDKIKATIVLSDHDTACDTACAITRPHGTIIQVAQPQRVSFDFRAIIFKDLRFKGSLVSSQGELRDLVDFVLKHKIRVKTNIYEGLETVNTVVDAAHLGKVSGKLVVVLDREAVEQDKAKTRW
ncbi:alcohol dehydrogenase -like domain-containing [Trichoderma arundinaceum]|uniref:Alcohol dehydrogenase-like domain-containing n=1 Tax=Trichoderma arundinaceum TaxID=490622 RepID=A0A395NEC9_TRIAR|nr:alcohol dehydrogenase -like domain-containing [Trichoderma arundinaceum]